MLRLTQQSRARLPEEPQAVAKEGLVPKYDKALLANFEVLQNEQFLA